VIVKELSIGWAQTEELRRHFLRLRERGKELIFLLEQATNKTYYLATAATRICLPPSTSLDLVGLRTETLFFKNLLSYLGVEPQLINVGSYKSAGEIFQREGMSESSREMTDSLLTDLQEHLVGAIAEKCALPADKAQEWIDQAPFTPTQALSAGLVDAISYEDEIDRMLEVRFPGIQEASSSKFKEKDRILKRAVTFRRPQIALILAQGIIMTGRSRQTRGRWPVLGAETLISSLKDAGRRRRVRALVLRIDSPGGSTLASDLIWRELRLLDRKKPVVITFGNVAASGGYYIATAGQRIYANSSTFTGSIGVIGGKFNIGRLLAKIGVSTDALEKGAHSGYASVTRPLSQDESRTVLAQMQEFYEDLFLPKVAASRGRSVAEIRRLAEGRVWTGAQAYSNGLVDGIGGLAEAIETARELSDLKHKKYRILAYTQRRSLLGLLPFQLGPSFSSEPTLAMMPEDFLVD